MFSRLVCLVPAGADTPGQTKRALGAFKRVCEPLLRRVGNAAATKGLCLVQQRIYSVGRVFESPRARTFALGTIQKRAALVGPRLCFVSDLQRGAGSRR
jgi:hypothetical protein